ncbi:MAG: MBL fold metallo-hydrolase [Micavibrio sp.]
MEFFQIYDKGVAQYAYLIGCEKTREAVIFDPQRVIEPYLQLAEDKNLKIVAVAETHIHADFLSGTREFLTRTDAQAYLSRHGKDEGWDYEWVSKENSVRFVKGGDTFNVGEIEIEVVHTPGHTPEHVVYLVKERGRAVALGAVTGDFVFVGDLGRPDLLETAAKAKGAMQIGAETLYRTVEKFRSQPESLLIWPGHGAGSACGKTLGSMPYSSWGYELKTNTALQQGSEQEFIDFITSAQTEPPLYFATMKKLNKEGVPLRGAGQLRRIAAQEFGHLIRKGDILFIDTRADRNAAMKTHIPSSLYVPFTSIFSTACGAVIEDQKQKIVLIIDADNAAEAQRRLANIGYDSVIGYITPDSLVAFFSRHDGVKSIPVADFKLAKNAKKDDNVRILDVRSAAEYNQSHLPDAINAPYTRLPESLGRIPRDKKLLVHCGSGARASVAATWLAAHGYDVTLINDNYSNACAA